MLTVNRQHSDGKLSFPNATDSQLLGFCTGAFAAAAVSSSQDLVQLIPAAVHATVVALYIGLRAAGVALSIDGNTSPSRWSMIVSGLSAKEGTYLLGRFNARNVIFS